ncbi:MAG: carbohydrate ABC transporter permease, partial [Alicyclobacillus shizuokensis]|nr:carbohydrate ABC transporter permease [Alicyclobacillus shizuokensis]
MPRVSRFTLDKVLAYGVLALIGIVFLVPLLWMIFASFEPNATLSITWPRSWSLVNFVQILQQPANQRAFLNGLLLSLGQSILVVLVAGLAAYPLSRYQLKYKRPFMYTILFSTTLPITAVMVPVYELFVFLHMSDSLWWT